MIWECGDCGRPESSTRLVSGCCHHCGLLLCDECGVDVVDGAFGGPQFSGGRVARHCQICRRLHHPTAVPLGGGDTG